jgi:hypothetical protein
LGGGLLVHDLVDPQAIDIVRQAVDDGEAEAEEAEEEGVTDGMDLHGGPHWLLSEATLNGFYPIVKIYSWGIPHFLLARRFPDLCAIHSGVINYLLIN